MMTFQILSRTERKFNVKYHFASLTIMLCSYSQKSIMGMVHENRARAITLHVRAGKSIGLRFLVDTTLTSKLATTVKGGRVGLISQQFDAQRII